MSTEPKIVGRLLQTQIWGLVAMRDRHAAEERAFCTVALSEIGLPDGKRYLLQPDFSVVETDGQPAPTPFTRRDADAEAGVA